MSEIKAIIPCCGYGIRVGMKSNESKEMLLYNGFSIIDYALDLCKATGIKPVLIVRPDKQDLLQHLDHKQVETILHTPTGEWYQTVLASKDNWAYNNILILPDTRFSQPQNVITFMKRELNKYELVFATHEVQDPDKWGCIIRNKIYEKPQIKEGLTHAWGLIGFNKYAGVELFSNMKAMGHSLTSFSTYPLDYFKDITRG